MIISILVSYCKFNVNLMFIFSKRLCNLALNLEYQIIILIITGIGGWVAKSNVKLKFFNI